MQETDTETGMQWSGGWAGRGGRGAKVPQFLWRGQSPPVFMEGAESPTFNKLDMNNNNSFQKNLKNCYYYNILYHNSIVKPVMKKF